jgi:hypothetical protein
MLQVHTEKIERDRQHSDNLNATQKVFNSFSTMSFPVSPFRFRNTLLLPKNRESYFQDLIILLHSLIRTLRNKLKQPQREMRRFVVIFR